MEEDVKYDASRKRGSYFFYMCVKGIKPSRGSSTSQYMKYVARIGVKVSYPLEDGCRAAAILDS